MSFLRTIFMGSRRKKVFFLLFPFYVFPLFPQQLSTGLYGGLPVPAIGEGAMFFHEGFPPEGRFLVGGVVAYMPFHERYFVTAEPGLMMWEGEPLITIPAVVHVFFGRTTKAYLSLGAYSTFCMHSSLLFNSFDAGMMYGAGFSFPATSHITFFVAYRMHYGLFPFHRDATGSGYYNSVYGFLTAGWYYRLIHKTRQ